MDERLPPPIQVIHGSGSGGGNPPKSDDDSLVEFKVKNPFQKFFDWIISFIKRNQNITIKIPIVGLLIGLGVGLGSGYNLGFNVALNKFFPTSSPVLHRAIVLDGIIQKSSDNKYYLKSENNLWTLRQKNQSLNFADYLNQQVTVKGNMTKEASVIEVSEIISLESSLQTSPTILIPSIPPNPSNPSDSSSSDLPALYPGLSWAETSKKLLIFTSGRRKIEQEGVYLESAQLNSFPQDFINYYYLEFKNRGFKETLNSINPEGITITYAKDELFLTFGIKNIYSGSKDQKQLVGYKAFIEHN